MILAARHVSDAEVGALAVIRDLGCPGPAGEIRLRLYDARERREAGPLAAFFHGGGFVFGDLDTHEPFCAEVARQLDLPVLAVDYRLAPEHPLPAGAEDCIAAARWAAGSPAALGREVTGLVACRRQRGRQFRHRRRPGAARRAGRRPGDRAMADLPRRRPGKGYPS